VVAILVDLPLMVVDGRVGLTVVVLCVLVTGREGLGVCEGFLVGERAGTAEASAVEGEVGDDALQGTLSSRGCVLLLELGEAAGDPREDDLACARVSTLSAQWGIFARASHSGTLSKKAP
jgi:hypothetical protein